MMDEMMMDQGRNTLSEQLAQRLENMIMNDQSQMQDKLPSEQTLALGFGVSRPVVREALAILRDRGLVLQKQGGGCYITAPKVDQVSQCISRLMRMRQMDDRDILEARVCLEIAISRLAAENITEEQIAELQDVVREMSKTCGDAERHAALDSQFHQCIAEASGNQMLAIFLASLSEPMTALIIKMLQLPHVAQDGVVYHTRIIECLRSHDADAAEEIMRQHMMLSMRNWEVAYSGCGEN